MGMGSGVPTLTMQIDSGFIRSLKLAINMPCFVV